MKRKFLLLTSLLSMVFISGFSQVCNDTLRKSVNIPGVPDGVTVTIDGKANEGFWKLIPFQSCLRDVSNAWTIDGMLCVKDSLTDADYNVKWKMAYDDANFYFFAEVTDESFIPYSDVKDQTFLNSDGTIGTTQFYYCDNLELFTLFAPDSVIEGPWSLTYASQLRMWPDLTAYADSITGGGWVTGVANQQQKGYMTKTVVTEGVGYTFEARIPFSIVVPDVPGANAIQPVEGAIFQLDLNPADRDMLVLDDSASKASPYFRENILAWNSRWNRDWGFTDYYGSATLTAKLQDLKAIDIPGVPEGAAITIDGKADEPFWTQIESTPVLNDVSNAWTVDGLLPLTPSADFGFNFKMAYDAENLYFFADVADESFIPYSDVMDQTYLEKDGTISKTQPYWCDNIELFTLFAAPDVIEGPWSLTYASQLRMWPDLTAYADTITGGGWVMGVDNQQDKGYTTKTVVNEGVGYTFEARIPFSIVVPDVPGANAIQPEEGAVIHFDVNPADRDLLILGDSASQTGPSRELITSWNSPWNRDWGFTDYYGFAVFGQKIIPSAIKPNTLSSIKVYPTIFDNSLTVDNLEGNSTISIVNLTGQSVYNRNFSTQKVNLDVENLAKGMYILSVNGNTVTKIVKK